MLNDWNSTNVISAQLQKHVCGVSRFSALKWPPAAVSYRVFGGDSIGVILTQSVFAGDLQVHCKPQLFSSVTVRGSTKMGADSGNVSPFKYPVC
jgi:hypothetical protein